MSSKLCVDVSTPFTPTGFYFSSDSNPLEKEIPKMYDCDETSIFLSHYLFPVGKQSKATNRPGTRI